MMQTDNPPTGVTFDHGSAVHHPDGSTLPGEPAAEANPFGSKADDLSERYAKLRAEQEQLSEKIIRLARRLTFAAGTTNRADQIETRLQQQQLEAMNLYYDALSRRVMHIAACLPYAVESDHG